MVSGLNGSFRISDLHIGAYLYVRLYLSICLRSMFSSESISNMTVEILRKVAKISRSVVIGNRFEIRAVTLPSAPGYFSLLISIYFEQNDMLFRF